MLAWAMAHVITHVVALISFFFVSFFFGILGRVGANTLICSYENSPCPLPSHINYRTTLAARPKY